MWETKGDRDNEVPMFKQNVEIVLCKTFFWILSTPYIEFVLDDNEDIKSYHKTINNSNIVIFFCNAYSKFQTNLW